MQRIIIGVTITATDELLPAWIMSTIQADLKEYPQVESVNCSLISEVTTKSQEVPET